MTLACRDDLLLRAVQRPGCGKAAGVLRGIRVADHNFLMTRNPRAIPVDAEQRVDRGAGVLKIVSRLEQRHDALWIPLPCDALQQVDGQHVGGTACHRDDVRAE